MHVYNIVQFPSIYVLIQHVKYFRGYASKLDLSISILLSVVLHCKKMSCMFWCIVNVS